VGGGGAGDPERSGNRRAGSRGLARRCR
jgi:hypothetical protein